MRRLIWLKSTRGRTLRWLGREMLACIPGVMTSSKSVDRLMLGGSGARLEEEDCECETQQKHKIIFIDLSEIHFL